MENDGQKDTPVIKTHGTRHHLWWPRSDYKTRLERSFRNHPLNSSNIEESIHNELHKSSKPPQKPSTEFMRQFLKDHPRLTRNTFNPNKPAPPKKPVQKNSVTIVLRPPHKTGEALKITCAGCKDKQCFQPIVEGTVVPNSTHYKKNCKNHK